MRILVVLAHPKSDSFNAAICTSLCAGLRAAGHEIDVADLYREQFNPVLSGPELENLGMLPPAADVASYQRRILEARGLAFIFPIWWFGTPAMLKGFIDRVFQEGFAFRFSPDGRVQGLLTQEKALVICTTGGDASLYRLFHLGQPLEKSFDRWSLRSCGIRRVKRVLFHDVVDTDDASRKRYLEQTMRLGREF